jgi:hypothetical protein
MGSKKNIYGYRMVYWVSGLFPSWSENMEKPLLSESWRRTMTKTEGTAVGEVSTPFQHTVDPLEGANLSHHFLSRILDDGQSLKSL